MSHATISRGLKTLKENGLISLLITDFKQGNLWKVSSLAHGGKGPDALPPQDRGPQNEEAQKAGQTLSKRGGSALKMSGELPQKESNIRSIKKEKNMKKDDMVVSITIPITEETTAIDPAVRDEAVRAFENELSPAKQGDLVSHFIDNEFSHGFLPPSRIVRSMVAVSWFQQKRGQPDDLTIYGNFQAGNAG
jgi:hypothetical protein